MQNLRAADPRASNIDITVTDITDEITDPLANQMILSYGCDLNALIINRSLTDVVDC